MGFGARQMGGNIGHVDQDTVHDPWNRQPRIGMLAVRSMKRGSFVLGRWCGQHDDAVARRHLSMRQTTIVAHVSGAFNEAERFGKPSQCGKAVAIVTASARRSGSKSSWASPQQ